MIVGEYELFTRVNVERGSRLEHDGCEWVMRDREDRLGVTVYIFTPVRSDDHDSPDRLRARSRRGASVR